MAFLAPAIPFLTAASAAVGIATGIKSLTQSTKSVSPPPPAPLPAPPTTTDVQKQAAEETKKRRRASLLSGGQTDITKGTATVTEINVGKKSLLGE